MGMASGLAIGIFVIGYLFIALEHKVYINKAATALLMGVILWVLIVFAMPGTSVDHLLSPHFEEIAEILFFLLGAMTIVELIDAHEGFQWVQGWVHTQNRVKLLWILSFLTFFLSAVLDNLTTTIVMVALLRKFFGDRGDLWFYAGFIVIAANAGGAWSPIGDVTTIMLWNTGHVTSMGIIKSTLLPSLGCVLLPLALVSLLKPAELRLPLAKSPQELEGPRSEGALVLALGVGLLLFVPVFKSITGLPPFMGMMLGLSVLWLVTEILHRKKSPEMRRQFSISHALQRIDTPSVLFFLGILLAVASLEVMGLLKSLGLFLEHNLDSFYVSNTVLGLLSSIIDNVPLVAGAIGMYSKEVFPTDHQFWTFLAYCAGTGGSVLIIGSAAGVAAMGILGIDFLWYLKRISLLALLGYFFGVLIYLVQ